MFSSPSALNSSSSVQMQPQSQPRSSSLPSQALTGRLASTNDRQIPPRNLSAASRASASSSLGDSPARTDGRSSPSYMMSPGSSKRQSLSSTGHPYQRPGSAGYRKNSGDSVASNLARYSQSLIQSQSQQLGNRGPQRTLSMPAPTSMPIGYANGPYQLQPPLGMMPHFRHPDYDHPASPMPMEYGGPPEFSPAMLRDAGASEHPCYSPLYDQSVYSASTPDLLSSESISTMDSRSSFSMDPSMYRQMPYVNQPYSQTAMHHPNTQTYDYGGGIPVGYDPTQWTPGADKLAKQYLDFANVSPSAGTDYRAPQQQP